MQTFLPWDDFEESAASLDQKRLGKQRVEAMQILNILVSLEPTLLPRNESSDQKRGWARHPATLMWQGYEHALAEYGIAICEEWKARGYNDGCLARFKQHIELNVPRDRGLTVAAEMPWWFGEPEFHESHRAMLMLKDPLFYGPQFPPSEMTDYWWPTHHA